jgi:hypothetical protein
VVDFFSHGWTRIYTDVRRETNSSILPNPCFIRVNPWLESLFASHATPLPAGSATPPYSSGGRESELGHDRSSIYAAFCDRFRAVGSRMRLRSLSDFGVASTNSSALMYSMARSRVMRSGASS